MAQSPSTDNYTLGKGVVYFNQLSSGVYLGERDLGNAPAFSFTIALEKLEHYSSRGGLRAKDKEIVSQISPSVTFTLDEVNKENLALLTFGAITEVVQTAGVATAEVVAGVNLDMRADLAFRQIGTTFLSHGTVTSGPFVVGDTVTGATSSATGIIAKVAVDNLGIWVATSDTFQDAEVIDGTTSESATTDAAPVWVPGVILVQDDADTVTYVEGTDYEVSTSLKDDEVGRIKVLSGGTVTAAEDIHVTYGYAASTYHTIDTLSDTVVEGQLRFISDNPAGTQQELVIWSVSLSPAGDTAMIGDDWSTLGFTGEVLKDESGHPTNPYMQIIMA